MDANRFDLINGCDFYEANIRMQDERDTNRLNVGEGVMIRFNLTIEGKFHNANG